MRSVHFEKWNLNNINITCPLRLEFVEEVELNEEIIEDVNEIPNEDSEDKTEE